MGEAPLREDGTVTRSAEVRPDGWTPARVCLFVCFNDLVSCCVKYVGSFPVDDLCLDEQIVQLHTQLKALKVSLQLVLLLIITFDE